MNCTAGVIIHGKVVHCDWPVDKTGTHGGRHANADHGLVWPFDNWTREDHVGPITQMSCADAIVGEDYL